MNGLQFMLFFIALALAAIFFAHLGIRLLQYRNFLNENAGEQVRLDRPFWYTCLRLSIPVVIAGALLQALLIVLALLYFSVKFLTSIWS